MRESTVVNEWKAEGWAESLLETLESRFPPGASPELASLIRANKDLTLIRQWAKAAWTAPTIEDFRRQVQP